MLTTLLGRVSAALLFVAVATHSAPSQAVIAFVQSTNGTDSASVNISATFAGAQSAGDLIAVVIAANGGTVPSVVSVTDTRGNVYASTGSVTTLANVGGMVIYYAKNIVSAAAGANTVTVTLASPALNAAIRLAEYSGVDTVSPLIGSVGASGNGAVLNSGTLSVVNADALLVAGGTVSGAIISMGAGYIERLSIWGDNLQDRVVSAAGNYNSTATQTTADGSWFEVLAAFKGASSAPVGDTSAPTTPAGLSANVTSSTQVNLSWSASADNVGVVGYKIERCQGAGCTNFAQIAAPVGSSYSDTNLSTSTAYRYQVRAYDAAGNHSGYSSAASATTLPVVPGAAIAFVQSTNGTDSASVNISATFAGAQSAGDLIAVVIAANGGTAPSVVSVTDTRGNVYASTGSVTTLANVGGMVIYYAKNIVSAAAGANTVTVTLASPALNAAIRLAEYSGVDTVSPLIGSVGASGNGATLNSGTLSVANADALLVAGGTVSGAIISMGAGYSERLSIWGDNLQDRVVSAAGNYNSTATQTDVNGSWFEVLAAFKAGGSTGTGDSTAPATPAGVTATAISSTQINLNWSASTDNVGVTGYLVERCLGAACTTYGQISVPTGTSYADTVLTAATTYRYRVRAIDGADNMSPYSGVVSVTTAAGAGGGDLQPPTAPASLAASAISVSQINLSWGSSGDNVGVTGYRLERCPGATCTAFGQIATPSGTTYSDTGLASAITYRYRVRANDAAGNLSSYSNESSVTTGSAGQAQFVSSSFSVGEGGAALTAVVSRTGGSSGAVSVTVSYDSESATMGADFIGTSQTLTWGTGDTSNKTATVPVIQDSSVEGNETFSLWLFSPAGGLAIPTNYAQGVIVDDDFPEISTGETETFTYDANGRLTGVHTTGGVNNGVIKGFLYDKADNRTQKQISGSGSSAP
jgi:chitodextrinase